MAKRNLALIKYYPVTGNAKFRDLDTGNIVYIMSYNEKVKKLLTEVIG